MPRAARDEDEPVHRHDAPAWLDEAVAGVWGEAEWTRWETRVRPALEEHGITVEILEPLYGGEDGALVGIGAEVPGIGWRVAWLGDLKHRRGAVFSTASDLLRTLDRPSEDKTKGRSETRAIGDWLRAPRT